MRGSVAVGRLWRGDVLGDFARRWGNLFGLGRSVAGRQAGFQHGERTRCTEGHGAGRNGASRDVLVGAWPGLGNWAELFRFGGVVTPAARVDAVGIGRCRAFRFWALPGPVRC
jgi:hypothetical protein